MDLRKFNIAILIIAIFLMSSCSNANANQQENKEIKEEVVYVDMSKEVELVNHIDFYERSNEFNENFKNEIKENTIYVKKDETAIFKDKNQKDKSFLKNKRDTLYLISESEKFYYVRDKFFSEKDGYILKENVNKSLADFIVKKYKGVDYNFEMPTKNYESNSRVKAKGIYLTINTAISDKKINQLIEMAKKTEINTFVIDVKNDSETFLYESEVAKKYLDNPKYSSKDFKKIMEKLKENDIYTIARIVTFKSPKYAISNPKKAITYKGTNTVYKDGVYWASAFDRELWDYNIELALEAADYGFNEIQFDYVRFPALSSSKRNRLDLKNEKDESRTAAIQKFLQKAYKEISKKEVYVAADIFGWTASSLGDEGIGQHWEGLVSVIDYSCPMIYPSHYGPYNFGLKVPDAKPYQTVYRSTQDAIDKNKNVKNPATLRPWIQDFTARWVKGYIYYGPKEVRAQIDALKDLGVDEYILWSPSNRYTWEALKK